MTIKNNDLNLKQDRVPNWSSKIKTILKPTIQKNRVVLKINKVAITTEAPVTKVLSS